MLRSVMNNSRSLGVRFQLLGFIGLLFILTASGCRQVDPVVKVGLVAPFEGRHRDVGYDVLYSARLAVREINEAGGIGGTRVALVALDDSGTPEFAEATARSLIIDQDVVAVVGHWLPETTAVAAPLYAGSNLLFLASGQSPFLPIAPEELDPDFVTAYTAVTPFDEQPGENAGPAYDAFQTLRRAMALAQESQGTINRQTLRQVGIQGD